MKKGGVQKSLRIWFIVHFIIDIIFAIPLIFFPVMFLKFLGFTVVDPITARLVGAALIGIGGASYFTRNKSKESYDILLTLKILWSIAAIITLIWSIVETQLMVLWPILIVFVIFSVTWIYYKSKLNPLNK